MALGKKKKGAEGADGDDKKAKKGKGNLVPAIIIAVGLVGGGKMMGGGSSSAETAGDEASTTTTTVEPGPVVVLEPITLNIAGGRFLKVGMALQLGAEAEAGGEGEEAADDPTKGFARALDIAIEVFGGRSFEELATPVGRDGAKEELVQRLREVYHDEIEDVYLTQFVMQ